jgi:hypothetical protein
MNLGAKFLLGFVFLFAGAESFALDVSCVQTQASSSPDCNHVKINFDFSKCAEGSGFPTAKEVRSRCVNGKAVSFVKNSSEIIIATYGISDQQGAWKFLSLRSESRAKPTAVVPVPLPVPSAPSANLNVGAPATKAQEETPKEEIVKGVQTSEIPTTDLQAKINESLAEKKESGKKSEETLSKETKSEEKAGEKKSEEVGSNAHFNLRGLEFSGLLDAYYLWDNTNPGPVTPPSSASTTVSTPPAGNAPYRLFDNYHDSLMLNLAKLRLAKNTESYEMLIDLGFGNFVTVASPNDMASQNLIKAYIKYHTSDSTAVTVGKLFSPLGVEEPYANENFNYSRSLLFTYAIPLWNTGGTFAYEFVPKHGTLNLSVFNNNSSSVYEGNQSKTFVGQVEWKTEASRTRLNYQMGSDQSNFSLLRYYYEGNFKGRISALWELNLDAIYGYQNQAVSGSYANWSAYMVALRHKVGRYGFSPRFEVYADPQGFTVNGLYGATALPSTGYIAQNLKSLTLTGSYELDEGALVYLEFRQDQSDQTVFANGNSQLTTTLATTLEF